MFIVTAEGVAGIDGHLDVHVGSAVQPSRQLASCATSLAGPDQISLRAGPPRRASHPGDGGAAAAPGWQEHEHSVANVRELHWTYSDG